jgi:hypothetical protein
MTNHIEPADVNNLARQWNTTESETIRDKYEDKVQIITDPNTIFDTFEWDQEAEDLLSKK